MKVLAVVYPGMTLLDMVGPIQAWSLLPGYEVQYAWRRSGAVRTDCGLSVQATHSFEDAWTDLDVLFVGGGAKPTFGSVGRFRRNRLFSGSRIPRPLGVQCLHWLAAVRSRGTVARLPCCGALGCPGSPHPILC